MSPISEGRRDGQPRLALGLARLPRNDAGTAALRAALREHLPASDARQADRCHEGRRRAEFLAGRFLLREILHRRFGLAAACIATRPCGRPCLADAAMSISISISHSSGWVVAGAVSRGRLGVDVEGPRAAITLPRRLDAMYRAAGVPPALVTRHWPLIEARAKCSGSPLGELLRRPGFCLSIGRTARRGWFDCEGYAMRRIGLPGAELALCLTDAVHQIHFDRLRLPLPRAARGSPGRARALAPG